MLTIPPFVLLNVTIAGIGPGGGTTGEGKGSEENSVSFLIPAQIQAEWEGKWEKVGREVVICPYHHITRITPPPSL